ncbi:hypothetical protein DE146DRAFT_651149 [Phaeosphaeria sp. MPI-PUGE-AT-0046c]|nr:hypothetical protein DE146DRAFT_651149 [Phaeosphaeria sp. MPI-PUGE-AT-0046c]
MKITILACVSLPLFAMSQAQNAAHDPAMQELIAAIREEIWAVNQMQLGAFYANHRVTSPSLQQGELEMSLGLKRAAMIFFVVAEAIQWGLGCAFWWFFVKELLRQASRSKAARDARVAKERQEKKTRAEKEFYDNIERIMVLGTALKERNAAVEEARET